STCSYIALSSLLASLILFFLNFFFSSRRRHTRFSRDWSSDVCSSDLQSGGLPAVLPDAARAEHGVVLPLLLRRRNRTRSCCRARSEERRVGKKCRSRRSP